jgi:hypothetical protein
MSNALPKSVTCLTEFAVERELLALMTPEELTELDQLLALRRDPFAVLDSIPGEVQQQMLAAIRAAKGHDRNAELTIADLDLPEPTRSFIADAFDVGYWRGPVPEPPKSIRHELAQHEPPPPAPELPKAEPPPPAPAPKSSPTTRHDEQPIRPQAPKRTLRFDQLFGIPEDCWRKLN